MTDAVQGVVRDDDGTEYSFVVLAGEWIQDAGAEHGSVWTPRSLTKALVKAEALAEAREQRDAIPDPDVLDGTVLDPL